MKFFTVLLLNICCIFNLIGATSFYQSEAQYIAQEKSLEF